MVRRWSTSNTAYRVRFNVTVRNIINKAVVNQDLVNPTPGFPAFAEDWQKVSQTAVVIAPGWEKEKRINSSARRVWWRIGYWHEALTTLSISMATPSLRISKHQLHLTSRDKVLETTFLGGGARVTEDKQGMNFLVGARGFIGVEYFIIPKISLGGEFGYMVGWQTQRRTTTNVSGMGRR
ncbi:MAG: hypothetical protein WDO15_09285 [Bacteroidota bacterium]